MSLRHTKASAGLSLRGLPGLMILAALQVCTVFAILSQYFGGLAGPVAGGAYYLSNQGQLIPVSSTVWHLMFLMQRAALICWFIFVLLGVVSLYAWKTQRPRYLAARNYSTLIVVVAIVDIAAVFCAPLLIVH